VGIWDKLDSRKRKAVLNFLKDEPIDHGYIYARFLLGEVEIKRLKD